MKKTTSKNLVISAVANSSKAIIGAMLFITIFFVNAYLFPTQLVDSGVITPNNYFIAFVSVLGLVSTFVSLYIVKQAYYCVLSEIEYCRESLKNLEKNYGDF